MLDGVRRESSDAAISPAVLARSPKRAAYAALFAPLALAGPWIGQGDWFYIAARKPA